LEISNRLGRLHQRMEEKETEAILISQPENRHYLSGFNGSSGFLLITPGSAILATDFRYVEQAEMQSPDYNIFKIAGDIEGWFPSLIDGLSIRRLGFESDHLSFSMYRRLSNILDDSGFQTRLAPITGLVEPIRAVKEHEEIELITQAVAISDTALDKVIATIKAGMTEEEVAWEIEKSLRDNGSQPLPFEVIVASGANAALPHARPSRHAIQPGEPLVIDIGARVQGYNSDLSRTICLSPTDDTFKKVYKVVLEAQMAAITSITEGMTGAQADGFAREIIEGAGYGDNFGHGLGHGLGLSPHEKPHLSPNSGDVLVNGMVFTIEPGIYLTGWGGVRTEDTVIMENGKIRVLSQARKMEVGI
jgi:Xaa-Pro aminopeptidase